MNGYRNLASSPPAPSGGEPEPAPSPVTAKEGKWEGAAVGAAAMVRNLSSASQRFAVERSKSTSGHRGGGFQAVVRRAFSMRRQPPSSLSEGYWRIHDGLDDCDDDAEAPEEVDGQKKHQAEAEVPGDAAASNDETSKEAKKKKKKSGHIFKACKKFVGFKHV